MHNESLGLLLFDCGFPPLCNQLARKILVEYGFSGTTGLATV